MIDELAQLVASRPAPTIYVCQHAVASRTSKKDRFLTTMSYMWRVLKLAKFLGREIKWAEFSDLWNCRRFGQLEL